jgi:hypothetical protein
VRRVNRPPGQVLECRASWRVITWHAIYSARSGS